MRTRSASEVAAGLSRVRFGPVCRRELLERGISPSQVNRWLGDGRLHPTRYPGVYAWGREELSEKGEHSAGLLFARRGSALDGLSALWWQGLLGSRPTLIHIASPGRVSSRADLLIRHPLRIDRRTHEDLPVVDLARALLVATPELEHNTLRLVLARADYDKRIPFSLPSLQTVIRSGPRGSRALRRAMAAHLPQLARCASPLEIDFVLLCEAHGLPIPEPNVRKGRYVPDMTWESRRLIVELDGKDAHTSPAQRAADAAKQRWLEGRGYAVLRFTWAQVQFQQGRVAGRVRAGLAG